MSNAYQRFGELVVKYGISDDDAKIILDRLLEADMMDASLTPLQHFANNNGLDPFDYAESELRHLWEKVEK